MNLLILFQVFCCANSTKDDQLCAETLCMCFIRKSGAIYDGEERKLIEEEVAVWQEEYDRIYRLIMEWLEVSSLEEWSL